MITIISWTVVGLVSAGLITVAWPLLRGTAHPANRQRPESDRAYGDRVTSGRPRRH